MKPDLSKDKLRIETKMNSFIRKGQPVPIELIDIYYKIITIEKGAITADNG